MFQSKYAALYIRVSTENQAEEGYSVQAQTEKLIAYCKIKEISNYELYVDAGFTGSNLNRPEMQRLICDANDGKVSHIIVYKLDRLSRSQKDTLYLIEDVFIPNEISFISINENMDTSTSYGRAMIGILSAFAQLERENIFMRTRMGMLERVKQGYWMGGGRVPYGYDYDRQSGVIVPNNDAEKVKLAYDLYIKGYSANRIAKIIGLKYDRLVMQILCRKSNTGAIVFNGVEYKGLHEAIVSEETYEKAMQKMRERSRNRITSGSNLLAGLCFCGECGARMRYQKWNKYGDKKIVCYSHDKSKTHMVKSEECTNKGVWAKDIEKVIIDDLFRISADMSEEDTNEENVFHDPVKILTDQYKTVQMKLERLYNLYAQSGTETLLKTIQQNEKELQSISDEIKRENKNSVGRKRLDELKEKFSDISNCWDYLSDMERQALIRDCVEKIIISNDDIEIKYKFNFAKI